MRFRILFSFLLTALFVLASSCGTTPNCPVCGTTVNGAYAVINVIPVPEHNNSGEPGGPFNSFRHQHPCAEPRCRWSLLGLRF